MTIFSCVSVKIFPLFLVLLFFMGGVEVYKYSGFFSENFHISFYLLLNLAFLWGFLLLLRPKEVKQLNRRLYINRYLFPVLLVFTILLSYAESVNYPNYIYSRIHLNPQNLLPLLILSLYIQFMCLYLEGIAKRK